MSELVFTNCHLTLGGNDLSDHVRSARLGYQAESKDTTAMSDGTRNFLPGLKNWTLEIEFNQDFADNDLDEILFAMVGTAVAFELRPDTGSVSTSNPSYEATGVVTDYNPLDGAVGDEAKCSISLVPAKSDPTLSRATSA